MHEIKRAVTTGYCNLPLSFHSRPAVQNLMQAQERKHLPELPLLKLRHHLNRPIWHCWICSPMHLPQRGRQRAVLGRGAQHVAPDAPTAQCSRTFGRWCSARSHSRPTKVSRDTQSPPPKSRSSVLRADMLHQGRWTLLEDLDGHSDRCNVASISDSTDSSRLAGGGAGAGWPTRHAYARQGLFLQVGGSLSHREALLQMLSSR